MGTKCKLSKHIKLIKELISNEIGLWLFMMAIIVIFPIIKIYDLHLFDNCEMNGPKCDGVRPSKHCVNDVWRA